VNSCMGIFPGFGPKKGMVVVMQMGEDLVNWDLQEGGQAQKNESHIGTMDIISTQHKKRRKISVWAGNKDVSGIKEYRSLLAQAQNNHYHQPYLELKGDLCGGIPRSNSNEFFRPASEKNHIVWTNVPKIGTMKEIN